MNELALFAGAGGGLLGSRWLLGHRTVCYVEHDPYCVEVIKARIADGWLDDAPIWDDAKTFDGKAWRGVVDCVSAGFPCQPFSGAGKLLGKDDPRNLWPDTVRIVREARPEWVWLENVSRLLSNTYVRRIFADLAESGYDTRWDCIPASAIGAPHQRDRVWIIAHANSGTVRQQYSNATTGNDGTAKATDVAHAERDTRRAKSQGRHVTDRDDADREEAAGGFEVRGENGGKRGLAYTEEHGRKPRRTGNAEEVSGGRESYRSGERKDEDELEGTKWWDAEPGLGRMAHGVAHRVDRLRAIGNGQVPAVVRAAWRLLIGT